MRKSNERRPSKLFRAVCWWKRKRTNYIVVRGDSPALGHRPDLTIEDNFSDEESQSDPVFDTTSMISPNVVTPPSASTLSSKDSRVTPKLNLWIETTNIETPEKAEPAPKNSEVRWTNYLRNSFSEGSLESIDSLVESYWDPTDDQDDISTSRLTPVASNLERQRHHPGRHAHDDKFFFCHVRFMRGQTTPNAVEVVWNTARKQLV